MCGILGWCNFETYPNVNVLRSMSAKINHRGPDAYGEFFKNEIAFTHRRLSIIDLSSNSNQPISDLTTGATIIFNGEIYNFRSLREEIIKLEKNNSFLSDGDAEVILRGYIVWGRDKLLEKLEGMFAFSIWDPKKKELFIARDRLGEKPLFYTNDKNKGLIFASEVKALLNNNITNNEVDYESLDQYLSLNYLLYQKTFFKNIKQLLPGNYLVFKENIDVHNIKEKNYWHLEDHFNKKDNKEISLDKAEEKLSELVHDSVKDRIFSNVNMGTFLSGGLDSSYISHNLDNINNHKMTAHNLGFDEKNFDESNFAKKFAFKNNIKLNNYIFPSPKEVAIDFPKIIDSMDQPMADTAYISNFYLSKYSSKSSKVILSGDGADEILGGYETYIADKILHNFNFIPKSFWNVMSMISSKIFSISNTKIGINYKLKKFAEGSKLKDNKSHIMWRSIFNDLEKKKLLNRDHFFESNNFFKQIDKDYDKVKDCHYLDRHMFVDLKTWFPNDILYKVDRTSMFHSQEGRLPFIDSKVVEFCCSLPINFKINFFKKKYILKKLLSKKIPSFNVNRKKSGFNSPIGNWLNKDNTFKEMSYGLLTTAEMSNYFNINELNRIFDNHTSKKEDNTFKIFSLIVLSQWMINNKISI